MEDWNATQYQRFQQERSQPAYDLMEFIGPRNSMRIVDLGCGAGEHTRTLHERFHAIETIGIDTSASMLAKAPRAAGLKFYRAPIEEFGGDSEFDLIFSNAALQWVAGHAEIFAHFRRALRPGGQLAIQMPKNGDQLPARTAYELEQEPPYNEYSPCPIEKNALAPEEYATLLHRLGFRSIKVRLFVYLHELASGMDTVDWLKGSMLNHYRKTQPADVYASFEEEFRKRIQASIGNERPYLSVYKRILMHAVR